MTPDLMDPRYACLPCLHGEHSACRGTADGMQFQRDCKDPCRCKKSKHTLFVGRCTDNRTKHYGYYICGKPAKTTMTVPARFSGIGAAAGRPTIEAERCGIHAAGLRRQAETDARYAAESKARGDRSAAERANRQAAVDWCDRLRAEFGIVASPAATAEQILVRLSPERLYGALREAVTEMDAAGIEHGFQPVDGSPPVHDGEASDPLR